MQKLLTIITVFFFISGVLCAQDPKGGSVTITSAFRPALRNAEKIDQPVTQLPADTGRPVKPYNVPAFKLNYAYVPPALRAINLQPDTNLYLGQKGFVQLGYGNFSTPFLKAAVRAGDGKSYLLNAAGDYVQSKGKLRYQQSSLLHAGLDFTKFIGKNNFNAGISGNSGRYHYYGLQFPGLKQDSLRLQYRNIGLNAGFSGSDGKALTYAIEGRTDLYALDQLIVGDVNEINVRLFGSAAYRLNDNFKGGVNLSGDITDYTFDASKVADTALNNNVFAVNPYVEYAGDNVKVHGGIRPVFDNDNYILFPDVQVRFSVKDFPFAITAGWEGRITKNNFKNLSGVNPWLTPMRLQLNTRETEYYGGLSISFTKRLTLNARAGLIMYKNLPLYINDTSGLSEKFVLSYEPTAENFRIAADVNFIATDRLSLTAAVTFNGYTGFNVNDKAWHQVPVELRASGRWQVLKPLFLKADFKGMSGIKFIQKGNISGKLDPARDLSFGAEYRINKLISVWGDANNVFNSQYQRWFRYPLLGANFLGGVKFHF